MVTKTSSMRHVEGGWPKDVDFTEQSDVSRFRKKVEKDEDYKGAVKALGPIVARCLKQNITINIYEVQHLPLRLSNCTVPTAEILLHDFIANSFYRPLFRNILRAVM